ncbi:MAG: deoxyuridine 5'-triphosphate nucleotidohydrolase [Candidatus Micrarchaeota archaeon]
MILSKKEILDEIIKNKLVENAVDLKQQVQPASLDLTLNKVFEIETKGVIDFDNSEREVSETREIPFENDWVDLEPGIYKVSFNEAIKLTPEIAGITAPRSSLSRSGCFVEVGFWDPGYHGKGESTLVVGGKGLRLKKNAKIAQMIFFKLSEQALDLYSGIHNKEGL